MWWFRKSRSTKEQRIENKLIKQEKDASTGLGTSSKDSSGEKGDSAGSDTESDILQQACNDGDDDDDDENEDDDYDYDGKKDDDNANASDSGSSDEERDNLGKRKHATTLLVQKPTTVGSCWSPGLAGGSSNRGMESKRLGAKNRLRQRPTHNSALDNIVVDSDNEISVEHINSETLGHETLPIVADSEVVADSEEVSDS